MLSALWLVALPVGVVPVVYLLRRIRLGGILAVLISLCMVWLVLRAPTASAAVNLLGRPVGLTVLSQITLGIILLATSGLFLTTVLCPPFMKAAIHSGLNLERRTFYPAGMAILGLLVAASLTSHLGFTALLVTGAAILTVFVIQGERLDSTRAALRFLILMGLATPFFLLASWQIDSVRVGQVRNLSQITFFISLGFAIWLAVIPFHSWLTTIAIEAAPNASAFVLISFPTVAFATLINLLAELPWLVDTPRLMEAIVIAGMVTAVTGGILASVQRGFGALMGYTVLYDVGCMLAMVGGRSRDTVLMVLVSLAVRALALTLLAASTSSLRTRVVSDGFVEMAGIARRMPISSAGLIVAGLTLAGAPFTAGFVVRWQLFQSLDGAVLIVIAQMGIALGYLRGLHALLLPLKTSRREVGLAPQWYEPPWLAAFIVLLAGSCILLSLYPGVLIAPLREVASQVIIPVR